MKQKMKEEEKMETLGEEEEWEAREFVECSKISQIGSGQARLFHLGIFCFHLAESVADRDGTGWSRL